MILRTEAVGMFLMQRGHFLIEIPAWPEEFLTIWELRVVAEATLLLKGLSSRTKCWTFFHGFAHNSLVSRPFLTYKVSNRSSHHALYNGQRAVSPIQFLVWSTVRSNLGQTWSNLVKALRTLGNVSWTAFWGFFFWYSGPQSGQKRLGQTSVKLGQLRSNLVNLGQTWSDFGKCVTDLVLRLFGVMSPRRIRPTWFRLPRFACRYPRKSRG